MANLFIYPISLFRRDDTMLIYKHFLISVIPSIILSYFYGWSVWIFMATNVLIDIDHYPIYIWKFKSLSLKKAHNYFKNLKECKDILLFHNMEFIILILIISFFYKILFLVFLGIAFHLVSDIYADYVRNIKRSYSITFWLIKNLVTKRK